MSQFSWILGIFRDAILAETGLGMVNTLVERYADFLVEFHFDQWLALVVFIVVMIRHRLDDQREAAAQERQD